MSWHGIPGLAPWGAVATTPRWQSPFPPSVSPPYTPTPDGTSGKHNCNWCSGYLSGINNAVDEGNFQMSWDKYVVFYSDLHTKLRAQLTVSNVCCREHSAHRGRTGLNKWPGWKGLELPMLVIMLVLLSFLQGWGGHMALPHNWCSWDAGGPGGDQAALPCSPLPKEQPSWLHGVLGSRSNTQPKTFLI